MTPEHSILVQLEPEAVAAYVHKATVALAKLARANQLPELTYFWIWRLS